MLRHRSLSQNKFLKAVGLECLGAYADARGLSPLDGLEEDYIARWLSELNDADRVRRSPFTAVLASKIWHAASPPG